MLEKKLNAALRLISDQRKEGVLQLYPEVLSQLSAKYPAAQPIGPSSLLAAPIQVVKPILFSGINGESVPASSLITHGGAGPSEAILVIYMLRWHTWLDG